MTDHRRGTPCGCPLTSRRCPPTAAAPAARPERTQERPAAGGGAVRAAGDHKGRPYGLVAAAGVVCAGATGGAIFQSPNWKGRICHRIPTARLSVWFRRQLLKSLALCWALAPAVMGTPGPPQSKGEALARVFSLLRSESYVQAARSLEALVQTNSSDAALQNLLGTTRERAGETSRAPSCYLRALQLRPDWSTARLNLALSYLRLGQRSAAAGQFARLVRSTTPATPALSFYHQAPIGEEVKQFARTLGSEQHEYLSLGGVFLVHELPEAASAVFSAGVEANPDSAPLRDALGRTWLKMKRFREAEAAFARTLELDPDAEGSCLHLGYAQASQGRVEPARETYAECVRQDPKDYAGHYFLGSSLLDLDRPQEAIAELAEALRLNPRSVNSRLLLGKAYAAAGREADALTEFLAVVDREPDHEAALFHLGTLHRKLGQPEEARKILGRFQKVKAFERQRSRRALLPGSERVDPRESAEVARAVNRFYLRYKQALLEGRYREIWDLMTPSSESLYGDFESFRATASSVYGNSQLRQRIAGSRIRDGNTLGKRIFCQLVTAWGEPLPLLVLVRHGDELKIDRDFDLSLAGVRSLGGRSSTAP